MHAFEPRREDTQGENALSEGTRAAASGEVGIPRVLSFVEYYLPGANSGGLARTIHNLVAALQGRVQFAIVTRNRDLGESRPYADVTSDAWQRVGPAEVFYASEQRDSLRALRALLRTSGYDVIYLNLLFSYFACVRVLLARRLGLLPQVPIVLAPRGSLAPAALAHKRLKKLAFLRVARSLGLYEGLVWQASSELERDDILALAERGIIDPPQVVLTPEIPAPSAVRGPRRPGDEGSPGALRIVYLARISAIKNLRYALEVLRTVKAKVEFGIYGPIESPEYWEECQRVIAELPGHIQARYGGVLNHSQVHGVLAQYDLLLFPTPSENFGHSILEALQSGCSVLTSDRTPWHDLEENGAGWIVPLERRDRFAEIIDELASMDPAERKEKSHRAVEYARSAVANTGAVERNFELFSRMAETRRKPGRAE